MKNMKKNRKLKTVMITMGIVCGFCCLWILYLLTAIDARDKALNTCTEQLAQASNELEELTVATQRVQGQFQEAELEIERLQSELSGAVNERESLEQTLDEKEIQVNNLKADVEQLNLSNKNTNISVSDLNTPADNSTPTANESDSNSGSQTTTADKIVALTFDDGPGKYTETLLDELNQRNARATFFVLGSLVSYYPDAISRMASEGHEIANHTFEHVNLTTLNANDMEADLRQTNSAITAITGGSAPTLVRPPGGWYNDTLKQTCADNGWSIIMWSTDTRDWESRDVNKIMDIALYSDTEKVKNGSIVLFHDIYETSVEAALNIIDSLAAEGYTFVTVSELLEIQGNGAQPGALYYSGN